MSRCNSVDVRARSVVCACVAHLYVVRGAPRLETVVVGAALGGRRRGGARGAYPQEVAERLRRLLHAHVQRADAQEPLLL